MVRGADRLELGAAMRATLKGPLAKTYPVSAAAEAVVRGIERRSRIVACPRWLIPLMWLRPLLPRLTEQQLRKDIAALRRDRRARGADARLGPGRRRRRRRAGGAEPNCSLRRSAGFAEASCPRSHSDQGAATAAAEPLLPSRR